MKNRKLTKISMTAAACAGLLGSAHSATLAVVAAAPSGADVLVSRGNGVGNGGGSSQATFGYRNADAAGTEGSRGRGQSFLISSTAGASYEISSLTLALANSVGNGTRPDGDLTLTVFEYDGAGATAAAQIDDSATWITNTGGTSGTNILTATLPVAANSTFASTQFLEVSFAANELVLDDDTAYGFFFQYTLDSVAGLSSDVTIAFDADLGTAGAAPFGMLLNTNVNADPALAANGVSATRDLNYFITGTVIPEPSAAILGAFGLLGLLRRRRR